MTRLPHPKKGWGSRVYGFLDGNQEPPHVILVRIDALLLPAKKPSCSAKQPAARSILV